MKSSYCQQYKQKWSKSGTYRGKEKLKLTILKIVMVDSGFAGCKLFCICFGWVILCANFTFYFILLFENCTFPRIAQIKLIILTSVTHRKTNR